MASDQESLTVDFPKRLSGRWGRFSRSDKQFSFACFFCLLIANELLGKRGAVLVLAMWAGGLVPTDYGRLYSLLAQNARILLRRKRQQEIWSANELSRFDKPEPIGLAVHAVDNLGLLHSAANTD